MIYCSKHRQDCKHLERKYNKGSFCIQDREPFLLPTKIADGVYGDLKAPDWCPLKNSEHLGYYETNKKENQDERS